MALFQLLAAISIVGLVSSSMRVLRPEYLASKYHKTNFDYHLSSFGRVPYGHTIVGNLRIPFPEDGCGEEVKVDYDLKTQEPLILVIKRRNCTFLEKVQNAQRLKAAMVIIVDDVVESMENVIPWAENAESLNIQIPSAMLDKESGSQLIEDIRKVGTDKNMDVVFSVSFKIKEQAASTVMFKFDLNDKALYETFFEIMNFYTQLKDKIFLMPIYSIVPKAFLPAGSNGYCLNDDKYCVARSDNTQVEPKDQPVYESLRQLCLSNLAKDSWWPYASEFYKRCITVDGEKSSVVRDLEGCSQAILSNLDNQDDAKKVQKCMEGVSNGQVLSGSDAEKVLNDNHMLQYQVNSPVKPTLSINGQIIFGRMTSLDVLKEICASLKVKPDQCRDIDKLTDVKYRDLTSFSFLGAIWFLIKLIIIGLISVGAFYVIYKMKLRKDMEKKLTSEVDSALANYYMQNKTNKYEGVQIDDDGAKEKRMVEVDGDEEEKEKD